MNLGLNGFQYRSFWKWISSQIYSLRVGVWIEPTIEWLLYVGQPIHHYTPPSWRIQTSFRFSYLRLGNSVHANFQLNGMLYDWPSLYGWNHLSWLAKWVKNLRKLIFRVVRHSDWISYQLLFTWDFRKKKKKWKSFNRYN